MEISDDLTPKPDELNKIKTRVGDGKLRRDTEDVLLIYSLLDTLKVQMPKFFTADSSRIPTFKDIELCKIVASITQLSSKVADLDTTVTTLVDVSVSSAASAAACFSSGGVGQGGP